MNGACSGHRSLGFIGGYRIWRLWHHSEPGRTSTWLLKQAFQKFIIMCISKAGKTLSKQLQFSKWPHSMLKATTTLEHLPTLRQFGCLL